jgi:hypothetical protein
MDEELALFDDGDVYLVLRRPRDGGPAIGTYRYPVASEDFNALAANGPGPFTIDLLATEQPLRPLFEVLARVREEALLSPEAVATFHGLAVPDVRNVVLAVAAAGECDVEFELRPDRCAVHFFDKGQPVGWQPFPSLETGFIAPDASGFGGYMRTAVVPPGSYGVIAFAMELPPGADTIEVQVAGTLIAPLPDEPMPERFEVRTGRAEIVR